MWALYISIFWWVLGKIPVKYKFNAKDSKLVAENFRKKTDKIKIEQLSNFMVVFWNCTPCAPFQ